MAKQSRKFKPLTMAQWRPILKSLPGYDPFKDKGDCTFDIDKANEVAAFFPECLSHVKGRTGGQPFVLERWELAIAGNLFGWIRPDGLRRFRQVFLYVGKKNGKTAFAAGLLIYVLACDGEPGAEIYSAACSRKQSQLVFAHAAGMVKLEPELAKRLKVFGFSGGAQVKSITYEEQMSSYQPLAADADNVDGANPHMAVIDELHRHKSPELADILVKSTAARSQPIIIWTTTADYDRISICNDKVKYARQVRDGIVKDAEFLPAIFELEPDDDWRKKKNWKKSNPNLGITITEEFLAGEVKKAVNNPRLQSNLKRLHFNIVSQDATRWIVMSQWDKCGCGEVDPVLWRERKIKELKGRRCIGGLDLGSVSDLTALALAFPDDDDKVILLPYFWVPEEGIEYKSPEIGDLYRAWIDLGFMQTTPGNATDYRTVREDINELATVFGIQELAIDRLFQGAQLSSELLDDGLDVVAFGQGFLSMAAPAKEFEERILSERIQHGNNPVMRWMAANATVKEDHAGNIKPVKPERNSGEKIDIIVASLMCLGRLMVGDEATSVYGGRGIKAL